MSEGNGSRRGEWREITTPDDIIYDEKGVQPEYITLHWSRSRYFNCFPEFHFNVVGDGKIFQYTNSPPSKTLRHTRGRNERNIAISASAMFEAEWGDYGHYPVKEIQKDRMAWLSAVLLRHYEWGCAPLEIAIFQNLITGKEDDEMPIYRVMMHSEWACLFNPPYGPFSNDPDPCWEFWKERQEMRERVERLKVRLSLDNSFS